jgi:hypothetical protein
MTQLTGDAFFPGGLGEFFAKKNEFLVFEEGPSVDVTLQWATYRDASDQTSLSRIWGGIHPPADDIPGRRIGIEIGNDAFALAEQYFSGMVTDVDHSPLASAPKVKVYPNPLASGDPLNVEMTQLPAKEVILQLINMQGQIIGTQVEQIRSEQQSFTLNTGGLAPGVYTLRVVGSPAGSARRIVVQ